MANATGTANAARSAVRFALSRSRRWRAFARRRRRRRRRRRQRGYRIRRNVRLPFRTLTLAQPFTPYYHPNPNPRPSSTPRPIPNTY